MSSDPSTKVLMPQLDKALHLSLSPPFENPVKPLNALFWENAQFCTAYDGFHGHPLPGAISIIRGPQARNPD